MAAKKSASKKKPVGKKQGTGKDTGKAVDFETAMAELQSLVETMEQGDLSLEDSLQYFERGIALTRDCQTALKTAEQKVQMLMSKNGQAELVDFADD